MGRVAPPVAQFANRHTDHTGQSGSRDKEEGICLLDEVVVCEEGGIYVLDEVVEYEEGGFLF